jgi:hypothetical protein
VFNYSLSSHILAAGVLVETMSHFESRCARLSKTTAHAGASRHRQHQRCLCLLSKISKESQRENSYTFGQGQRSQTNTYSTYLTVERNIRILVILGLNSVLLLQISCTGPCLNNNFQTKERSNYFHSIFSLLAREPCASLASYTPLPATK